MVYLSGVTFSTLFGAIPDNIGVRLVSRSWSFGGKYTESFLPSILSVADGGKLIRTQMCWIGAGFSGLGLDISRRVGFVAEAGSRAAIFAVHLHL
jgi:hypothetical protein